MNHKPLRLLPGVVIAILQVLVMAAAPLIAPDEPGIVRMLAAVIGALLLLIWWLFFSRARWAERLGAIALIAVGVLATKYMVHESIAGAGQGFLVYFLAPPYAFLALVAWAAATRNRANAVRSVSLVGAIVLGFVPMLLVRTSGIYGGAPEFFWRWTPTPEERLLAQGGDEPKPLLEPTTPTPSVEPPADPPRAATPEVPPEAPAPPAAAASKAPAAPGVPTTKPEEAAAKPAAPDSGHGEWPGFRGPNRDGVVNGVQIRTDWAASPPAELWRRPIGPGWSSFAVRGDLFYTQEQRGEDEMVSCYRVSTGEPVWRHRDRARFYESNGGAGPRATPTIHNDRVYAFGATGLLNALDARSGKPIWSRNVATDTGRQIPFWGFASSPLVIDDKVIVAAAGTLAAYDLATGTPKWKGPSYGGSYSSPHRATIDGVVQVLLLGGPGAISVDPATGTVLWKHEWQPGPIVQPAVTDDGDVIVNAITATGGVATRRLHIARDANEWRTEERWTSNGLKPNFNDFVLHKGYAYGFDNNILASISLVDGKRAWKGGRYGNGQLVLLADQDVMLVISEDGELALVQASPDQFKELARLRVFEAKTWNHPVVVGNILLVRNGEEMAAFRLAPASSQTEER